MEKGVARQGPYQELRAIWIPYQEGEKWIASPQDDLLKLAEQGFTDLIVQVYRFGKLQRMGADERFSLPALLPLAHSLGLKVHAWINCFYFGEGSSKDLALGDLDCIRDQFGVLAHIGDVTLDTPGMWADPASQKVQSDLSKTIQSLAKHFPTLDGVHLDYIRYPFALPIRPSSALAVGVDFGYSESALKEFTLSKKTEVTDLFLEREGGLWPSSYRKSILWDDFRRQKISSFVRRIRAELPEGVLLTAAVGPWLERAYLSAFQHWTSWIEEGIVDFVFPMVYTADSSLFRLTLRSYTAYHSQIIPGIGAYLLRDRQELQHQQGMVESAGFPGHCLFSIHALPSEQGT